MPKVLVVDDSVSVRKVVQRALEARQIQVVSAALGSEAIELIERDEPDLVVSDVILPDRDGYQICEFVRAHPRLGKTPVLLMSGIVNPTVLERAARAQSDELLRKPFAADELARKIDDLLSRGADRTSAGLESSSQDGGVPAPPAPPAPGALAAEPSGRRPDVSEAKLATDLRTVLGQVVGLSGVHLAVLVDREGFVIESAGEAGGEAEVTGALAACLTESSDGIGRELGRGALQSVVLEYEGGMVLLHGVGSAAILGIVLRDAVALGKVRSCIQKTLLDLSRAI